MANDNNTPDPGDNPTVNPSSNVVSFPGKIDTERTAENVLHAALGMELKDVLIAGLDKDGNLIILNSDEMEIQMFCWILVSLQASISKIL